jgi:hypothetical protein
MTVNVEPTGAKAGTAPASSLWREIELYLAFWAIARPPVPAAPGPHERVPASSKRP